MRDDAFFENLALRDGLTVREARGIGRVAEILRALQGDELFWLGLNAAAVLRHHAKMDAVSTLANDKQTWATLGEANEARAMPSVLRLLEERYSAAELAYAEEKASDNNGDT